MSLLPVDGQVEYIANFLSPDEAQALFDELLQIIPWKEEDVKVYGKVYPQPRLTSWHADPGLTYKYSGLLLDPEPWTERLLDLKTSVEESSGTLFNSVLLNLYRDQKDSNGWHADDEKELGPNPIIASLSLGETREFHLRHKTKALETIKIPLESGSLLIMGDQTQKFWKHSLPKRTRALGPRINLTFRKIL